MKRGTAMSMVLFMMPHMRRGRRSKNPGERPMRPNRKLVPIMVKVTGKPTIRAMVSTRKSQAAR